MNFHVLEAGEAPSIPSRPLDAGMTPQPQDAELRSFAELLRAADAAALERQRALHELRATAAATEPTATAAAAAAPTAAEPAEPGARRDARADAVHKLAAVVASLEALVGQEPPSVRTATATELVAWVAQTLGPLRASAPQARHSAEAARVLAEMKRVLLGV